jgi:hypothetical protein
LEKLTIGPETQAFITGTFTGQKLALELLVRLMHTNGVMDASLFTEQLKATYNEPDAKFEKQSYEYFLSLAASLDEWIANQSPFQRQP